MKTLSLMLGLVLCGPIYAEENKSAPSPEATPVADKSEVAGTTIGKSLRDEIRTMKDKALKLKDPMEKILGISSPEKRLADTLLALEKNPEKIDLAIEYCSALETIITELRASILSTLETNLTKQQKTVVDGLGQLAVVVDENVRKAGAEAEQLSDPEARKRYENLASDYRKIAGAYRIVAKKYAELPLADQIKKLQQQVEYLEDVREFVVHVREVAIPLVGSQNALDQLREYTVAVGHVQQSVSRFASILSEGVVKFDPEKRAVEIIKQQSSPASPANAVRMGINNLCNQSMCCSGRLNSSNPNHCFLKEAPCSERPLPEGITVMTTLAMIMVVVFAESPTPDLIETLRSQLANGSVLLSDYEALVRAETSLPEGRRQEWLVIRGFYAWSLALRKPRKELASQAIEEAKKCLMSARKMGAVDPQRICPGECWDAVPLAARVYWNELPDPARGDNRRDQTNSDALQRKTGQVVAVASLDHRLVELEHQRKQAEEAVKVLADIITDRQKLLADLDTQLQTRQNQLQAKQAEVENVSATLLGLQRQIAEARTILASLQQERQAMEPRVPTVRTGALPDHVTSAQRYTIREGQLFTIGKVTVKMRDHHDGKDGATFVVGERKVRLNATQHLEIDNHFYLRLIRYGLPQSSAEMEIGEFNR